MACMAAEWHLQACGGRLLGSGHLGGLGFFSLSCLQRERLQTHNHVCHCLKFKTAQMFSQIKDEKLNHNWAEILGFWTDLKSRKRRTKANLYENKMYVKLLLKQTHFSE